ncbi:MAG TPA: hypothetical protein PLE48_01130 [Thiobacillus sp.]|nr:MAG: hypothetical protein B7Y21_01180 [Hydrogenophilales bacterium 16-61-112]OZA46955.1 MAG: hypothetical protein B7X81_05985 [Hydrogenophilales bacterium 17-61-76]HQT30374.1 hypothetical protein [Thiobacillus sp.]HQT69014.1 hypothetical protein [Thiobacillus sp.]
MNHSLKIVMACFALFLPVAPAMAEYGPSKAELAALPAYCAARLDEKSAAFKSWQASMGRDFLHIHHYCFALNSMNRARGMASGKDRLGALGDANINFNYVLKNTLPDFYLRSEMLMNRGITMSMMNRDGEAIGDLLRSIEINPKQPRAYTTLADMYEKQNNRKKALETVIAGLRYNPDSKGLQRRYSRLGGKLPYPAPIEPIPVETQGAKTDAPVSVPENSVSEADSDASATDASADKPIAPPQIGSPTNPYCRFCPN